MARNLLRRLAHIPPTRVPPSPKPNPTALALQALPFTPKIGPFPTFLLVTELPALSVSIPSPLRLTETWLEARLTPLHPMPEPLQRRVIPRRVLHISELLVRHRIGVLTFFDPPSPTSLSWTSLLIIPPRPYTVPRSELTRAALALASTTLPLSELIKMELFIVMVAELIRVPPLPPPEGTFGPVITTVVTDANTRIVTADRPST